MTRMTRAGVIWAILAQGVVGCSPTAPSPTPEPTAPRPAPGPGPSPPVAPLSTLRGTVHDAASTPLAGALIQAWSGPEAYATSDANGQFSIHGPEIGSHLFHASREGYVSQLRSLDSGLTFVLEPLRLR